MIHINVIKNLVPYGCQLDFQLFITLMYIFWLWLLEIVYLVTVGLPPAMPSESPKWSMGGG